MSNESLLIQILARLPCRDAIRYKLVCKRWSSLISSDYFISFFIHCSNHTINDSTSPTYRLAFQFKNRQNLVDNDYSVLVHCERSTTHRVLCSLDLSFLPCRPPNKISVRASCDDLIICSFQKVFNYRLCLCNPQTKQYVALPLASPPPPNYHRDFAVGLLCDPAPCSFCHDQGGCGGVDNSRYKFMVMRIHMPEFQKNITEFQVQLFSSEEGEWRNYVVSSSGWTLHYAHIGCLVPYKGKLHWLNYPYVLVFDPYNAPGQVCRVIDLPFGDYNDLRTLPPSMHSFGVFNDRLRVAYSALNENPVYNYIRELEDYDSDEWRLVQKLSRKDILAGSHILPDDGNVVCFKPDSSATWLCNFQSGVMDKNEYELIPRGLVDKLYIISSFHIADQCWPTPIPSLQLRP